MAGMLVGLFIGLFGIGFGALAIIVAAEKVRQAKTKYREDASRLDDSYARCYDDAERRAKNLAIKLEAAQVQIENLKARIEAMVEKNRQLETRQMITVRIPEKRRPYRLLNSWSFWLSLAAVVAVSIAAILTVLPCQK